MADKEDDMPDTVRTDDLAVTNQRVNTLERSVRELGEDQHRMGKELASQISGVSTTLATKLEGVVGQLNERNKIQWPALSVLLGFIVAVGGLVYWPIKDNQTRFESHLLRIAENSVSQKELDQRFSTTAARRDDWQRASEERYAANKAAIDSMREAMVPRWMHDEKWRVADRDNQELRTEIQNAQKMIVPRAEVDEKWRSTDNKFADLQRQIDKQEKMYGETYGLRDIINRLIRKQDDLEDRVRKTDRP